LEKEMFDLLVGDLFSKDGGINIGKKDKAKESIF
jgi:hypothetical protein